MSILSIDIGEKNLGWTIAYTKNEITTLDIKDLEFDSGVFDYKMKRGLEVVKSRVSSLTEFFRRFDLRNLKLAIIERQVPGNHVACELMYAVTAILYQYTENVVIFDPKLKFSHIGQIYDTKNKKHKKQSILNMNRMLATSLSPSFSKLKSILDAAEKKDDIADSFNQLIIELSIESILTRDLRTIYNTPLENEEAPKTRIRKLHSQAESSPNNESKNSEALVVDSDEELSE